MTARISGILSSNVYMIVNILFTFVSVPIYIYFVGASQYGLYQIAGTIIAYLSILDFGIYHAVVRYYTEYLTKNDYEQQRSVLNQSFTLYMIIAVLICIACLLLYFTADSIFAKGLQDYEITTLKYIILVLIVELIIVIPGNLYTAILSSHEKFLLMNSILIGEKLLLIPIMTLFIFLFPSAFTISSVLAGACILCMLIKVYYCTEVLHVKFPRPVSLKGISGNFTRLAKTSFAVFVADQLIWKSNIVLLGMFSNTVEVAIFSIASVIFLSFIPLSQSISKVFFPKITTMIVEGKSEKELSDLFVKIGKIQFILLYLVLLGFIVAGRDFISLWAGPEFSSSYTIALCIIIPALIELTQNLGNLIMQARNQFWFRAKCSLIVASVNILISIPVIQIFGSIGCAVTTGFSMLVLNGFIMNLYYKMVQKLDVAAYFKSVSLVVIKTLPAVIPLFYICFYCLTTVSWVFLIVKLLILITGYSAAIYYILLSHDERAFVKKVLGRP